MNYEELKTLKDLILGCGGECGFNHVISVKELKAEAAKWVKEIKRLEKTRESPVFLDGITIGNEIEWNECPIIIDMFKHFFNLTEEDLYSKNERGEKRK